MLYAYYFFNYFDFGKIGTLYVALKVYYVME